MDVNREVWAFVGMRDSSLHCVLLRMIGVNVPVGITRGRDINTAKQL